MKAYNWNIEKNEALKLERNISFEEVVYHIEKGDELDIYLHPNQDKHPNQMVSVVASKKPRSKNVVLCSP